jgi:hypothetical protein
MTDKLDLKKDFKHLYNPSAKDVSQVDVPPFAFLMIDGSGDPATSQDWKEAVEALYAVSYALKFMIKRGEGIDYAVMPLEGLWWTDDMREFSMDARDIWKWTGMILQPDWITADQVQQALDQTIKKKDLPALSKIRYERYHEGLSAQILHLGPYADEPPTIARLHAWILDHGFDFRGANKHHEIYLSDPRKSAPDKMKTILRQPMLRTHAG